MRSQLGVFRTVLLAISILSGLVVFGAFLGGTHLKGTTSGEQSFIILEPAIVTIYVSISTSILALLGFLVSTSLSFRREKREAREAELRLKQKEIDLERSRLELEHLKDELHKKEDQ
jgi:hypothetical protein